MQHCLPKVKNSNFGADLPFPDFCCGVLDAPSDAGSYFCSCIVALSGYHGLSFSSRRRILCECF